MNDTDKIAGAIGNIDDRFVLEAFAYRPRLTGRRKLRLFSTIAAGVCLIIGMAVFVNKSSPVSISVHAYESRELLAGGKTTLMPGSISDSGEMKGHPLMFYVLGHGIESIRFSCKNEWISFVDWTEQRGDFGLSKNFTVAYGKQEKDYDYLVVDWVPENMIRKLTDNPSMKISDLSRDEKEDMIVMEIRYLNGENETAAIWIRLNDNGEFEAFIDKYQIKDDDWFVYQPDSQPIEHQPQRGEQYEKSDNLSEQSEPTEDKESATPILSEEEFARLRLIAEEYYTSLNYKMLDLTPADPESSFHQEYEGYLPDEVVLFEVYVENIENKRYITIGSKDNWNNCEILNEGY